MARDKIATSIRKLNRIIKREWRLVEPELKRRIRIGDCLGERRLREHTHHCVDKLIRDWVQWRLMQPPFTTKQGAYLVRHPVTPENAYLLKP